MSRKRWLLLFGGNWRALGINALHHYGTMRPRPSLYPTRNFIAIGVHRGPTGERDSTWLDSIQYGKSLPVLTCSQVRYFARAALWRGSTLIPTIEKRSNRGRHFGNEYTRRVACHIRILTTESFEIPRFNLYVKPRCQFQFRIPTY